MKSTPYPDELMCFTFSEGQLDKGQFESWISIRISVLLGSVSLNPLTESLPKTECGREIKPPVSLWVDFLMDILV